MLFHSSWSCTILSRLSWLAITARRMAQIGQYGSRCKLAVVVLYLPWLGVALQRLPEWQSPAPRVPARPGAARHLPLVRLWPHHPDRTCHDGPGNRRASLCSSALAITQYALRHANRSTLHTLHALQLSPSRLVAHSRRPHLCLRALQGSLPEIPAHLQPGLLPAVCARHRDGMARGEQLCAVQRTGKGAGSPAQFWQTLVILLLVFVAMFTRPIALQSLL